MYWSDNVQKRVLAELLRPRLYNAKLGTMTHHAWYWVKKTQYMDPPVGQKLLIEALIRHYPTEVEDILLGATIETVDPTEVEDILLGATIETVEGLINLLERIQARDKMSNSRDNRHEHPRNLHHMNRGRGQGQDRGHGRGGRYRNRSLSSGPGNEEMQKHATGRAKRICATTVVNDEDDLLHETPKPDRDTQLAERREYVQQLSLMMKTIYCMKHEEEIGDSSQQALVIPKIEIGIDNWG
ncbi:hypothetical protein QE152_g164 [Popillia japonica]|uniref:Uncharacterized protein n=1 Tax=Popillia japonica TaxID=7064 RepID=A0AAW1NMC9_POPJA